MTSKFISGLYINGFETLIAWVVLMLSLGVINLLVTRKMESHRLKQRFRVRSFYVACIIFLFIVARIWVEGFTHLLTILGLVSAALVITNKETIMNFVGFLVITWRELFSEEDLIQIQQHKGYVKAMGMLYITLAEVLEGSNDITGRTIRVPNGLVSNNPLINYSQTSHLLEQHFSLVLTQQSELDYAIQLIKKLVDDVVGDFYKDKPEYSIEYLRKRNKGTVELLRLETKIAVQPKQDKVSGIELTVRYYCFCRDTDNIQQKIWFQLLEALRHEKKVQLAYER